MLWPLTEEQPGFQTDKSRCHVRDHGRTHNRARVAMYAGRDIHSVNIRVMCIDRRDSCTEITTHITLQPAAEHRVNQQLRFGIELTAPACHYPAFCDIVGIGCCCITRQRFRVNQSNNRDDNAILRCEPRNNISVATVISRAAHDLPAARSRKVRSRLKQRRQSGALHKRVALRARLDRYPIYFANSFN